jgi:GAF domain-containing protein
MTGDKLVERLSVFARQLEAQPSPAATLDAISRAVVGTVSGVQCAGLTLVHQHSELETVAPTDPVVEAIDQIQYEVREGPCLDALYHAETVRMNDMASEPRWSQFTARARSHGMHSMLCARLFVSAGTLGALNTYAAEPNAYADEAIEEIRLFATHAAVALASSRKVDQLTQAVATRDVIGQAKGILMERHKINADEAFAMLVRVSQRGHLKLREVAERLVETGVEA